jgi:hypothetical protein
MGRYVLSGVAAAVISVVSFSSAYAGPYCRPCPFSCYELGLDRGDCTFLSDSRGVCCVDLSKKGHELVREQDRVANGGRPGYGDRPYDDYGRPPSYGGNNSQLGGRPYPQDNRPPPPPPAAVREECPPGFRPSEQKCSPDERRRGCKDIRLPGGLGCVKR